MKIKNILTNTILGSCVGIAIGTTIELVFSALFGPVYSPGLPSFLTQFDNVHTGVLIERVVYAFYGVICTFAGKIYESETRPLPLSTAIHLAITVSCGVGAGVYLHWWSNLTEFAGLLVTIAIIYLIMWAGFYLLARSDVEKLNEQIKAKNAK